MHKPPVLALLLLLTAIAQQARQGSASTEAFKRPADAPPLQANATAIATAGATVTSVDATTTSRGQATNATSNSTGAPPTARLLGSSKPSAPYAIDNDESGQQPQAATVKNLIFRLLALNRTGGDATQISIPQGWSLVADGQQALANVSAANLDSDQQAGSELRNLLGSLNESNSYASGLRLEELLASRPVFLNLTIAKLRNLTELASGTGPLLASNRLFLEDLLGQQNELARNANPVLRDNHRSVFRPALERPKPSGVVALDSRLTLPPIRRTPDVVAENYTTRKVADEANNFALKLISQLNVERLGDENIIHSPFAVYQGLALLLAGAMGDTSRELDKLLLSAQSVYENTKLTHDQDRARLLASFGDVVRQLQASSTNHFQPAAPHPASMNCTLNEGDSQLVNCSLDSNGDVQSGDPRGPSQVQYRGGSEGQHFIVANNLLFSPSSFEISPEFKQTLASYHNNTALTRMEVGSSESIQVINGWVRAATAGLIPAIMSKRSPFDEFNVMTLLSTSWLSQEWLIPFKRVSSSLRAQIKLRGQQQALPAEPNDAAQRLEGAKRASFLTRNQREEPLMEFVDDHRRSHFVEHLRSEPSRHIHNYHITMNKQWVDVVVVPFCGSNQRLVTITPLPQSPAASGRTGASQQVSTLNSHLNVAPTSPASTHNQTTSDLSLSDGDPLGSLAEQQLQSLNLPVISDPSQLTRVMGAFAMDPRRALRSLWNTIAPALITKQTLQNLQSARQRNASGSQADEKLILKRLNIPPKTQLLLPLIRLDADSTISASLNHIGLVNAFDSSQANFIGINGHPFNYNKLQLSNVLYKTTFNLNEDGINYDRTVRTLEPMRLFTNKRQRNRFKPYEMDLEPGELVNEVRLDKPFMFLVVDIKTKLVLYTGVVRNPAKEISSL